MQNQNTVFINDDGIIEIQVIGDQTVATVEETGQKAMELAAAQKEQHKPALLLDNLLAMGAVATDARKLVLDMVKSSDYDKFAMLSSDPIIRFGANLILQATGRGTHVKYFDDREACTAWLLSV